jgi:hypothetical protein
MTIRLLPAAALIALIAPWTVLGQTGTTRVLRFSHTSTKQQAEEILIAMTTRSDLASGGLSVQGIPDQVKLGAWLFAELDKSAPVAADTAVHEYRLAGGTENVVRVFFLDRGQTVDELQEFVTMLRTIADLPRAFTCNTIKTVALRGTSDQMALADWFVNELGQTKPAPRQHSESPEYLLPAAPSPTPSANVARIFYFANTPGILDFYQVTFLILALTDIQRMFTYKTPRAFAVRGTSDQVALAEWLFNELDQPAHPNPSHKSDVYNYRGFDRENAVAVRVFYLPQIGTVQEFQRIVERVVREAKIRRIFALDAPRVIAVRGTTDQVSATERLLTESDTADFPKAQ